MIEFSFKSFPPLGKILYILTRSRRFIPNDPKDTLRSLGSSTSIFKRPIKSIILETPSIPSWIKNNAGWWADGTIDDNSFVQGIQFLVKENILKIPSTTQGTSSSNEIPVWIKNNAGWWADGSIDDNSFVQGIQFLVQEGFMKITN